MNAQPRKVSCKLEIGSSSITDVKRLTYSSDWSGNVTIGQAVSSYITATVPTPGFSIAGANVTHSMGITVNSSITWTAIGQYTVDHNSIRIKQGYTTFSAYDKLHTNNVYTARSQYAETLQGLCNDVCSQIGIGTVSNLGNIGAEPVEKESLNGYTLREVLGFVAALCGTNAYVSASNDLVLKWFTSSGYTADGTRANIPYVGEADCTISRLICQGADGVYTTSNAGEGIYFTCPLINQDNQQRLLSYLLGVVGLTYRKAEIDIPYGNYCLQSGDIITVSTTGTNLTVPIMSNSWTYDGGLASSVTAYGVSDYTGTANNAAHSLSDRKVQERIETQQTITRELTDATALITGAKGGHIRITFDGTTSYPAEILIMDAEQVQDAHNVWVFNQNGLGHFSNGYNVGTMNLALTMNGTVVAERIAGTKISGVKVETFYKASSGTQSHIMIEDGTYTINKATIDGNGNIVGNPTVVGKLHFIDRAQMSGDRDTVTIQVQPGNAFTIGTLDQNNPAGLGNSQFYYYSDLNNAPSGAKSFTFYANLAPDDGVKIFGDVFFDDGTKSLMNIIYGSGGILDRLDDLERRVTALENA